MRHVSGGSRASSSSGTGATGSQRDRLTGQSPTGSPTSSLSPSLASGSPSVSAASSPGSSSAAGPVAHATRTVVVGRSAALTAARDRDRHAVSGNLPMMAAKQKLTREVSNTGSGNGGGGGGGGGGGTGSSDSDGRQEQSVAGSTGKTSSTTSGGNGVAHPAVSTGMTSSALTPSANSRSIVLRGPGNRSHAHRTAAALSALETGSPGRTANVASPANSSSGLLASTTFPSGTSISRNDSGPSLADASVHATATGTSSSLKASMGVQAASRLGSTGGGGGGGVTTLAYLRGSAGAGYVSVASPVMAPHFTSSSSAALTPARSATGGGAAVAVPGTPLSVTAVTPSSASANNNVPIGMPLTPGGTLL